MKAKRRIVLALLAASLTVASGGAHAQAPTPSLVQSRVTVGASTPLGDTRRLHDAAADVGIGATLARPDARFRARGTLGLRRAVGVGGDASLTFLRLGLGIEARGWRSFVLALEGGPTLRRTAVGSEVAHTVIGGAIAFEVGWRFRLGPRWSLTPSLQATSARYADDRFFWQDVAVLIGAER